MTAKQISKVIGSEKLLQIDQLKIPVEVVDVVDVKGAFARSYYLVAPIGGAGQQWVDATRVS